MPISDRLDEIEARHEATTQGQWLVGEEVDGVRAGRRTVIFADGALAVRRRVVTVDQTRPHHEPAECNIEFIAHAHTDVPAMLAALRAVLDLHEGAPNAVSALYPDPACNECGQTMPCPTVRAVTAALGEA